MLTRIGVLALNTYREAVRARLLLGIFALAIATCVYSLVIAAMSLHSEVRVVADLGSASLSLYAVVIAITLGSTSLYRELELKTIFPILSRPVRRWEYVLAKYLGTLLTVAVFVAFDAVAIFAFVGLEAGQAPAVVGTTVGCLVVVLAVLLWRLPGARVYVLAPFALAAAVVLWIEAAPAGADRQLVLASAVLGISEVAIVAAIATFFSSFSSPVLTATFTAMIFVVGRSSDTLAHLPQRLFGKTIATVARGLARVFPNLQVYVPSRALLLGEAPGVALWPYVATAALHATLYAMALVSLSVLIFRKRDFV